MSNPLEEPNRLYVWEVGGSDSEPTDTGLTGTLGVLMETAQAVSEGRESITLPDGRKLERDQLAGYQVRPEAKSA